MCNNSKLGNGITDSYDEYAKFTANTGIAEITTANTSMAGAGAVVVLTAAGKGTIVKSVIIKATMPITTGMVRLFINDGSSGTSLYKEIPISTTPVLKNTPTPLPMLKTFEIDIRGGLRLQTGYKLLATTQNGESFNVIAEGLDWAYPTNPPLICCTFVQETAVTGLGTVTTANAELNGGGAIVSIFTAPNTKGSLIKTVTVKALQVTNEGMLRLFISPDGSTWSLMQEIYVPVTNQSGFEPSFKQVINLDFYIKAGYEIGASTQIGQSFAFTVEGSDWNYA